MDIRCNHVRQQRSFISVLSIKCTTAVRCERVVRMILKWQHVSRVISASVINCVLCETQGAPAELQQATTEQRQLLSQTLCAHPTSLLVATLNSAVSVSIQAELQGPGGIQSRGYFLYRPRNGRRSLEYE
uniref:Neuromedin U C-terminal domain-containing protein n=1 Tax=Seriola dumerili TaxID=41447 RepID=A0A3B4VPY6_SERDU